MWDHHRDSKLACLNVTKGQAGMSAFLTAFILRGGDVEVAIGWNSAAPDVRHFLFTVSDVTAALTPDEAHWFCEQLVYRSSELTHKRLVRSLESLGRNLLVAMASSPMVQH